LVSSRISLAGFIDVLFANSLPAVLDGVDYRLRILAVAEVISDHRAILGDASKNHRTATIILCAQQHFVMRR
jgi:hypothetical protein